MNWDSRLRTAAGRTLAKAWRDRVLGLSAEAAFWQLLSLPSLALALLASLGLLSGWFGQHTIDRAQSQVTNAFARAFSSQVVTNVVAPTIHEVLHGQRVDIVSVGFLLSMWAGSSATATFVNTTTIAYGMRDERGAVRSRLRALALFLGSVLIGVILLPLLVLGPSLLTDLVPESQRRAAGTVIHDAYYPVVIALALLALTSFYHVALPRRLPWRRGVPGAVLGLAVFLAGSAAMRAYIAVVLAHNHAYTALAAPIAALLFFYVLALGVLLGAELNAAIEELSPAETQSRRHRRSWQRLTDPADLRAPDP